ETTYFMHGGTWRKLASATQGGAAVFGLQASSDGQHAFGGQEVKVGFDNFTVTGVDPTCAPGAQPGGVPTPRRRYDGRPSGALAEWLGTGLQNLVHRFDSGRRLS